MGIRFTGPEKYYYYLLLALTLIIVVVCLRLQNSRIGRAWEAIREDEIAAKAMGINTRNIKLLAFAMGASFGGVAGALFASMQGFVSQSFSLMESISILCMVVLGGMGHIGRDRAPSSWRACPSSCALWSNRRSTCCSAPWCWIRKASACCCSAWPWSA